MIENPFIGDMYEGELLEKLSEVEKDDKAQVIHDFASAEYEQRKEYDDAIEEMIKHCTS